jgi:D-cysteine desulfhydrase
MTPAGLARQPRVPLGTLPTPLHPAPRLSAEVGVEIWLKRDDLTGLGLGGNKVRALEFVLGAALAEGADTLLTGGGPSSNWVMLAALAARTRGMHPVLVIYGSPTPLVGNLALAELAGAEIHFTGEDDRSSVERVIDVIAGNLRATGRKPYSLGRGGATATGALGYLAATGELVRQTQE